MQDNEIFKKKIGPTLILIKINAHKLITLSRIYCGKIFSGQSVEPKGRTH